MGVGLDGPGTCDIGGWKPPILVFLPAKAALCLEMRSWRSAPLAIAPCDHVGAPAPGGMLVLAGDPLHPSGEATRGAAAREPPAAGDGDAANAGRAGRGCGAASPRAAWAAAVRRCRVCKQHRSHPVGPNAPLACMSQSRHRACRRPRPPPSMSTFRTRRQNSRCTSKL